VVVFIVFLQNMGQKRLLFLLAVFTFLVSSSYGRGGNATSIMILCLFPLLGLPVFLFS
jgi:hypothetical protein